MPSLHLTASASQPAVLLPVPGDGKIHTIPLGLGLDEEQMLRV